MEETFAQIAGAAQHSIADVNVSISSGGSIVGQGVTASGGALQICGGNLDKILQSFGGIEGGNTSLGGKSLALLNHVGILGGKVGAAVDSKLKDVKREVETLKDLSHEAEQLNNDSVKEQASNAIAQLGGYIDSLKTASAELSSLGGEVESAKNAVQVLSAQGGMGPTAAAMSLGISQLNKLSHTANRVNGVLNNAEHISHNLRQQLGAGTNGGNDDVVDGGALNTNGLADRLLAHRKAIQKLVNEFIQAFGGDLNKMVSSVNSMAADLGKRIDYDEKTQVFLETFERVREFMDKDNRSKMYQYLLELDTEKRINSKEMKERFLSLMRDLSARANAMDGTSATKEFASACNSIASTVNQYSDKMKSFRDDIQKSGGSTETMNELFSVDASRVNVSALVNPLDNLALAVKKIDFYRNIAVFRSNLNQTNKEIETYSKDYAKSVGKAIGEAITKIQNEYIEIINSISDNKTGMGLEIDMYNESQASNAKISKEKLKLIYKWQCDARVGLYKTVEAIDMYLLHFTETVTKNPDAVADLQKLLTATSIIAKWYDNKAGDNLIRVFETFATFAPVTFPDEVLDDANFVSSTYNSATAVSSPSLDGKLSGDRANKLYERCRRAVEGVVVLKNIISYFITISEKYGSFKSERNIYMAPSNIYKNLVNYIWVSALDTNTAGFEILTENNDLKRVMNYQDTNVGIAKVTPIDPDTLGINFNRHSIDKLRLLKTHGDVLRLRDFISTLDAEAFPRLKQFILATFARLGKTPYIFRMIEFGVFDITTMSNSQLVEFLTFLRRRAGNPLGVGGRPVGPRFQITGIIPAGGAVNIVSATTDVIITNTANAIQTMNANDRRAIRIGVQLPNSPNYEPNRIVPLHIFTTFTDFNTVIDGFRYADLVINNLFTPGGLSNSFLTGLFQGLTGTTTVSEQIGYTKRSVMALEYLVLEMIKDFKQANSSSVFAIDDTYFILTIKAIAGKVMAVTGINSIYKNPNANHNHLTQNATRLIMGGAEGDVEIIDDAVELYVRLPLLVEFYRNVFDNGNKDFKAESVNSNLDNEQISYVPEIGHVWSGLLINIFDKSKHIDNGLYTQENMQKIVSEVNSIYKHYKSAVPSDELTRHIMTQLVSEINRRFGVIKRQELLDYFKVVNAIKKNDIDISESNYTNNDLDILGESLEFEEKAPSDSYIKTLQETLKDTSVSQEVKVNKLTDYKIVKDFRGRINVQLEFLQNEVGHGPLSLRERIRFLKKAIASKQTRHEKYEMIIKAIEESDTLNQTSNDIFMCFHEFVVMPLRTLVQMHGALKTFMLNMYALVLSADAVSGAAVFNDVGFTSILGDGGADTLKDKMLAIINANATALFSNTPAGVAPVGSTLKYRMDHLLRQGMFNGGLFTNAALPEDIQLMMMDLIMQFSANAGELVKLNITTTKRVTIDLSEYQKVCEHLVANVKYMIDKFTGLVPTALLDAVTKRSINLPIPLIGQIENTSSIYYLEDELVLKMFNKQNKKESDRDVLCIDNLYHMTPVISNILFKQNVPSVQLIKKFVLHDIGAVAISTDVTRAMPIIRDAFMQYRKQDGMFVSPDTSQTFVGNLLFNPRPNSHFMSDTTNRPGAGVIQEFNTILAQYMNDLYDQQSRKIYTKAFASFAGSALIDALNGQSIKDFGLVEGGALPRAPTAFGYDCPANQTILSATLAYVMKVMINRVNPITGMKIHEIATIQEISPHMLEKYRMLIPMYLRICKAFITRCRHYRKIVGYMAVGGVGALNIQTNNGFTNFNTEVKENANDQGMEFAIYDGVRDSLQGTPANDTKSKVNLYLDEIVNAMSSLIQDMETVQKELLETDTTVTLYFDVKKDFTKNYMASNKIVPFAPLSILAMAYPNTTNDAEVIPLYKQNSVSTSKFLYGLRTMLVDDFKITSAKVPYLKKLITDFNGYATSGNIIAEAKFNDVLQYVGKANNFIYDLRFYNGKAISRTDLLRYNTPTNNVIRTYQEQHATNASMSLVESVNTVDSVNTISEYISAGRVNVPAAIRDPAGANPRSRVIIVNLLDLKIMPLNVHSLMREIPLANLYNYAMTFDAVVDQFTAADLDPVIKTLLITPYVQVNANVVAGTIAVNGAPLNLRAGTNSDLRFISDSIFDKMAGVGARQISDVALTSRLNTKLVRNLMFLTLVQYAIKKKVKREIEFINTRVVSNVAAVSDTITNARTDLGDVNDNLFEF